jgi:hypothetical protein
LHEESIVAVNALFGNAGIGFNLNAPIWVEQTGDDDHGGGGKDDAEEFAVDSAGRLPVFDVREIHAGAVDVLDGRAGVFESGGDEGEALVGLFGDVGVIGTNGASAGDVDVVADADRAGETDDGLEGRCAGDVRAFGHVSWMPCGFGLNQVRLFFDSDEQSAGGWDFNVHRSVG